MVEPFANVLSIGHHASFDGAIMFLSERNMSASRAFLLESPFLVMAETSRGKKVPAVCNRSNSLAAAFELASPNSFMLFCIS
jgi:hypothetical protein